MKLRSALIVLLMLTAFRFVAQTQNTFNPIQGIANPSDTKVINYIGSDGVQNRISQSGGGFTPPTPTTTAFLSDDFTHSHIDGAQVHGQLEWTENSNGSGSRSTIASEANHPGILQASSGATTGSSWAFISGEDTTGQSFFPTDNFNIYYIVRPSGGTFANCDFWVGTQSNGTDTAFNNSGVYFQALHTDSPRDWYACNNTGSAHFCSDTGVAITSGSWYDLNITISSPNINYSVNGGSNTPVSIDKPTGAQVFSWRVSNPGGATTCNLDIDLFQFSDTVTR